MTVSLPPGLGALGHVGVVVSDIEATAEEFSRLLGLSWAPLSEQQVVGRSPGGATSTTPVKLTWSVEGPLHLELLSGPSGTVWSAEGGNRLHHVGFWSDDVRGGLEQLEAIGMSLEIAGIGPDDLPAGYAYLLDPEGRRIELLDAATRAVMERWLARGRAH